MAVPENPRYPHTCRILRVRETPPMEDQPFGYSIDEDTSPLEDSLNQSDVVEPADDDVPTQDEEPQPPTEDGGEDEGEPDPEADFTLIYEGECRAYDKHTTSDKGELITSYRGLALPMTREDWTKLGVFPLEGDRIIVDRGGYVEYGQVVDKNPANFGGTHLVWKYGRN